jgi:hypothetical protein
MLHRFNLEQSLLYFRSFRAQTCLPVPPQYECKGTNKTKLLLTLQNSPLLPRSRFTKPKSVVGITFFKLFGYCYTLLHYDSHCS